MGKTCRICGARLRPHEAPELICDFCLRLNQTRPIFLNPEPKTLADPDLGRIDPMKEVPDE